jgi:MFS family permease
MNKEIFYGYKIIGASIIIQGICYGATFTYGLFFSEFQSEFGWSRATISGASSLSFLIGGALGIPAGRVNDKIGPRALTAGTSLVFGLGYFLLSWLQSPWQLYLLYGLFVAVGFGSFDVITLSTISRWFVRRRGIMSGIVKVGTGSGQILLPFFAAALISSYGWRHAYFILGVLFMVLLVAVALVLRHSPSELGLRPDNERSDLSPDRFNAGDSGLLLKSAIRMRQFWAINLAEFTSLFCLLTIVVHIVPHAIDLGVPTKTAGGIMSVIGGASILGRFVMGAAHDRIAGRRSLLICFFVLFCSLMWLQVAREAWMLFTFAFIYGFAHGGLFTVISPTVAELFGTRSHGVLYGIILFSGNCAGAIGPILAGHIFDVTGSYRHAFLLLSVVSIIGLVLVTQLRSKNCKGAERKP